MRKKYYLLTIPLIAFLLTSFVNSSIENYTNIIEIDQSQISKAQIDAFIKEVYGEQANKEVFNKQHRYNNYTDLFQNRLIVLQHEVKSGERYQKLSEISLRNKYNSSLTRDVSFNPNNFNVLKYMVDLYPEDRPVHYRVDNSNYLIKILPQ